MRDYHPSDGRLAGQGLRTLLMSGRVGNVVELLVGLGCLAAALAVWRIESLRWLALVFAVAGLAAAIHAAVALGS